MGVFDFFTVIVSSSELWEITFLSFLISGIAVTLSSIIGIPIGVYLGLKRKKERFVVIAFINTAMGLPPVVVGLVVYLIVRRQGALGQFRILFSPTAMILAQMILTLPIIIGITRSTIRNLPDEILETIDSLGATEAQKRWIILAEGKSGILIAIMVALGRAFSEVGAVLIVGGNIRFHTRVLTTAIVTEISKGANDVALAMGFLLLTISFSITSIMTYYQLNSK